MAYEQTQVPVAKSQGKIRDLILRNGGTGIAFVSEPPMEGFHAQVVIDGKTYQVRIVAKVADTGSRRADAREREEKRIWRVLYHHLKSVYEAANTGVMEFRELMLPYVVTASGKTIAEHILPQLERAILGRPDRMLGGGERE